MTFPLMTKGLLPASKPNETLQEQFYILRRREDNEGDDWNIYLSEGNDLAY